MQAEASSTVTGTSFSDSEWVLATANVSFSDSEFILQRQRIQFRDNYCINLANIHRDDHKFALFKSLSQSFQLASVQLNILFIHSGRGLKTGKGQARFSWEATVFVMLRSKERPRNGIFGFGSARYRTRAKKWKMGRGRKERNSFRQTPGFWKPRSPVNGFLNCSASRTLTFVDRSRFKLRGRDTHIIFLRLLSLPSDASTGNPGPVMVPQYGSSKIKVLYV